MLLCRNIVGPGWVQICPWFQNRPKIAIRFSKIHTMMVVMYASKVASFVDFAPVLGSM